MALSFFRSAEIEPPPDIEAASLRSDRFRLEREGDWQRLDAIVTALERGRPSRISDADLLELPVLYRKTASSLAIAREISLDAAALAYLEALVRRAWFQVYGARIGLVGWLRRFLGGGWSTAVRDVWLDLCIALAVSIAGAAVGWLLVDRDPEWFYALVPANMAGGRVPGAPREVLQDALAHDGGSQGLSIFAASLFSNNTSVAILAFALGFAFGIPTLLLLVYNMALLGAMLWVFHDAGLAFEFGGWLSVHGTTELFAIVLAGAAGLHVGRTMAFPGERSVLAAMRDAGVRAAQVMAGCTLMMVIAGLLEAYPRQLVDSVAVKYLMGTTMLVFWVLYFLAMRPPREHET